VAEALKFADSNGETLVVVTADHETGGLTILDGDLETGHVLAVYNSDDHTPTVVPVFAYGRVPVRLWAPISIVEIARTIKRTRQEMKRLTILALGTGPHACLTGPGPQERSLRPSVQEHIREEHIRGGKPVPYDAARDGGAPVLRAGAEDPARPFLERT
jgi:Alkaline phosphatase